MLSPTTLIDLNVISAILYENKRSLFVGSLMESPDDLTTDDVADDVKRPLNDFRYYTNGFIVCISKKHCVLLRNGRTSYVSDYFYCRN